MAGLQIHIAAWFVETELAATEILSGPLVMAEVEGPQGGAVHAPTGLTS